MVLAMEHVKIDSEPDHIFQGGEWNTCTQRLGLFYTFQNGKGRITVIRNMEHL
jgi:hypothetical protein